MENPKRKNASLKKPFIFLLFFNLAFCTYFRETDGPIAHKLFTNESFQFTASLWLGLSPFPTTDPGPTPQSVFSMTHTDEPVLVQYITDPFPTLVVDTQTITTTFSPSTDSDGFHWLFLNISCDYNTDTRSCHYYLNEETTAALTIHTIIENPASEVFVALGSNGPMQIIPMDLKIHDFKFHSEYYVPGVDGYNPFLTEPKLIFLVKPYQDNSYTKVYKNLVDSGVGDLVSGEANVFTRTTNIYGGVSNLDNNLFLPSLSFKNFEVDNSYSFILQGKIYLRYQIASATTLTYERTIYQYRSINNDVLIDAKLSIIYDVSTQELDSILLMISVEGIDFAYLLTIPAPTNNIVSFDLEYLLINISRNIMEISPTVTIRSNLQSSDIVIPTSISPSDEDIQIIGSIQDSSRADSFEMLTGNLDVFFFDIHEIAMFSGSNVNINGSPNTTHGYGRLGLKRQMGYIFGCPNMTRVKRYDYSGQNFWDDCTEETNMNESSLIDCFRSEDGVCYECDVGYTLLNDGTCSACGLFKIWDPLTRSCFLANSQLHSANGSTVIDLLTGNENLEYLTAINAYQQDYSVYVVVEIKVTTDYSPLQVSLSSSGVSPDIDPDRQVQTFQNLIGRVYNDSSKQGFASFKYENGTDNIFIEQRDNNPSSFYVTLAFYDNLRDYSFNVFKNVDCKDGSSRNFIFDDFYRGRCLPVCPDGTFDHNSTGRCRNCPSGCEVCDDFHHCTACHPGYYLYENDCLACSTDCVTCSMIAYNCHACTDPAHELVPLLNIHICAVPGSVDPSAIISEFTENLENSPTSFTIDDIYDMDFSGGCEHGEYLNLSDGSCKACIPPCIHCLNESICEECDHGYNLVFDECKSETGPDAGNLFFSEDGGGGGPMEGCDSGDSRACMICKTGYYKDLSHKCHKCGFGCDECEDDQTCHVCQQGKTLKNGTCEQGCVSSEYRNNGKCVSCDNCEDCKNCASCFKCFQQVTYRLVEDSYNIFVYFLNDLVLNDINIDEVIQVINLGANNTADGQAGDQGSGGQQDPPPQQGGSGGEEGEGGEEGTEEFGEEGEGDTPPPREGEGEEGFEEGPMDNIGDAEFPEGEGDGFNEEFTEDDTTTDPPTDNPIPFLNGNKRRLKKKLKKRKQASLKYRINKEEMVKLSNVLNNVQLDDVKLFKVKDELVRTRLNKRGVVLLGNTADDPPFDPYAVPTDPYAIPDDNFDPTADPYGTGAPGYEFDPYGTGAYGVDAYGGTTYYYPGEGEHNYATAYDAYDTGVEEEGPNFEENNNQTEAPPAEEVPLDPQNISLYTNDYFSLEFVDCNIDYTTLSISIKTLQEEKALKINFYDTSSVGSNFIDTDCSVDLTITKNLFSKLRDCSMSEDLNFKSKMKKDHKLDALASNKAANQMTTAVSNIGSTGLILIGLGAKQILNSFLVLLNSMNLIDLLPLMQYRYDNETNNTIGKLTFSFDFYFNYTKDDEYYKEFESKVNSLYPKALQLKGNAYANQTSFKFVLFVFGFLLLFIRDIIHQFSKKKFGPKLNYVFEYFIGFSDSFILSDSIDFVAHYTLQYKYIMQSGTNPLFMGVSWLGVFLLTFGWFRTFAINKKVKKKENLDSYLGKYEFFFPYIIPNYTRAFYFNSMFILRNVVVTVISVIFFDTFYYSLTVILLIQAAFVYFNYLIYSKMSTIPVFSSFYSEVCIFVIFFAFLFVDFLPYSFFRHFIVFVYFSFSGFSMLGMVYAYIQGKVEAAEAEMEIKHKEKEEEEKEGKEVKEKLFAKLDKPKKKNPLDFIDQEDEYDPKLHTYGSSKTNSPRNNTEKDS